MLKILLTNDDGVFAPGLRALRKELLTLGDVTIVGPMSEQSAAGHSITLLLPLVAQEIREEGKVIGFAVEGKPADCVKLGIVKLLDGPPDLVVSGINAGSNAGINVLYSGTVAAAIEGAFFNITSIAVSLELAEAEHFPAAAKLAVHVIRQILAQGPKPGELFNVNIPCLSGGSPSGVAVAEQALDCYRETYEARIDPRGRQYYWLLPDRLTGQVDDVNDLAALARRCISVTPLHFDLTAHRQLERMRDWEWTLP